MSIRAFCFSAVAAVSLCLCPGCARTPPATLEPGVSSAILGPAPNLERGADVYVTKAAVSEENTPGMRAFGADLEKAFQMTLAPYASAVFVGETCENKDLALASGKKRQAKYTLIPSLYRAEALPLEEPPTIALTFFFSVFDTADGTRLAMRQIFVRAPASFPVQAEEALMQTLAKEISGLYAGSAKNDNAAASNESSKEDPPKGGF